MIKVEQFCALSTATNFQTWLYEYDRSMYKELISHLRTSSGCSANRQKMVELFSRVNSTKVGESSLNQFVSKYYSHLLGDNKPRSGVVFEYYPGLLTYPHRFVISGRDVESRVREFVAGKGRCEFVIVDGVGYIEYLDKGEDIVVPVDKWLVLSYKNKE